MTVEGCESAGPGARIKVFGIGGGGTNAVSTMIRAHIDGVDFISANTDIQSLQAALAPRKIQIGKDLTKGLGAGADPDIGRDAALEDRQEILECVSGADMVFVTAGMGGGTGTGGAAIVAQIAKESGALTVGVVTKPFGFEGKRRRKHADIGIDRLKAHVDTLLVIPNDRLLHVAGPSLTMLEAFRLADTVLVNAVRGISDIINVPGTINVDFADVKTVMSNMGQALMGIGSARGEGRAKKAAMEAISSPLLEDVDIEGATGLLINITAGETVSLAEVNEACTIVEEAAHDEADIIFGAVIDPSLDNELRITVIATGFPIASDQEFVVKRKGAGVGDQLSRSVSYHELARQQKERQSTESGAHSLQAAVKNTKELSAGTFSTVDLAPVEETLHSEDSQGLAMDLGVKESSEEDELTKWTLSQLGEAEGQEAKSPMAPEEPSLESSPYRSAEAPSEGQAGAFVEEPSSLRSAAPQEVLSEGVREQGPIIRTEGGYEDFFHQVHDEVVSDLDRRIDEALKLTPESEDAQKKSQAPRNPVEVPAFLRDGSPSLDLT
ncbi:MAG: cell division protein FtsZ [Zetaproteobacteria bacterium]|nr:cell division protein FtsZ [Zetaproteobacteria bacterium]